MSTRPAPGWRGTPAVPYVLYFLSLGAVGALLARGSDFYLTPAGERARHPDYWDWKAGGTVGHTLGVAGSSLMLLMLLYSLRKRVRLLRRAGRLQRWLDVHIYFGVIGPLLVVLHSSFKVHGLVALSFWSMVVVACSGVVGRYLYQQIPRAGGGEERTLDETSAQDAELTRQLQTRFGLDAASLAELETATRPRRGMLGALLLGFLDDLRVRSAVRRATRGRQRVPRQLLRELERVVRERALVRRRILFWDRIHELFHYWLVLHKPFAVVMYLFMAVHVAVAIATGYGWSGRP